MRTLMRGAAVVALALVAIGAWAESSYTVKPGETLFSIARERLGDVTRWRELFEMNRDKLENPDQVKADMVLRIPSARPSSATAPAAAPAPAAARTTVNAATPTRSSAALVHVLQAEETLGSVALKYLGAASRWSEIYELNKDRIADPNRVQAGTVLRLPAGAVRPTATAASAAAPASASAPAAVSTTVPTPTPVVQLASAPSAAAAAMAASGAGAPNGATVAVAADPVVRPISDGELRQRVDEVVAEDNARAAAEAEARAASEREAAAREAAAREVAAREAAAQEAAVREAAAREAAAQEAAAREASARDEAARVVEREAAVRAAAEREAAAQEAAHREAAARMAAASTPQAAAAPAAPERTELTTRDAEARSTWEEAQRELAAARARSGQHPARPEVQVSYAPQSPAAVETRGTQGENAAVAAEANRQAVYNATPVPATTVAAAPAAPAAATSASRPPVRTSTSSSSASAAPSAPVTAPPAWKKVFTQNFSMRSGGEDARQYQALFARELQRRWQQSGNWAAGAGSTDYIVMGEYWSRGTQLIVRVDIQRGFTIAKSLQWTVSRAELAEGGHFFDRMAAEINTYLR